MTNTQRSTVVGVFKDQAQAQAAIRRLKERGFNDHQIGFITHGQNNQNEMARDQPTGSRVGEGSALGAVGGAGVGALWALGIAAGALPAVGPAVAGGILMSILASAGGAAAVGTVLGGLIGLGVSDDDSEYYENEFKSGNTLVTVQASERAAEAWNILQQNGATQRTEESARETTTNKANTEARTATAGQTMQLHEEQLRAEKTPVETGEARVRKEVSTHQETLHVPVTHEEVIIERRPVSGQASAADIRPGEEVRIPVREERVNVTKETVPIEEVYVGKQKVTENKEVGGTVRKEQVRVEREGDVEMHNTPRK